MRFPLLLFFLFLGGVARADVINIENEELARLVASGVPVIDVRTEGEWKETGIVAGSRLLTFFDERGKADPPAWLARLKSVTKADAEQPVIVICRSGNRTRHVAQFLEQQAGYKKVYNVKYGIQGWIKAGLPVTPAAPVLAGCAGNAQC